MSGAKGLVAGLKVVELGWGLAASLTGMLFADNGADVIKVEPLDGDHTRKLTVSGAGFFPTFNRNKKSIAVDLKSEEGKEIIAKLIRSADVVTENFRPGAMDKLGFGYEQLKQAQPQLIYCSLKGFLAGPYENRAGLDETAQMMGGLAYMTGPVGRPLRAGASVNDVMGGMFAAIAILSAFIERGSTGRGQHVKSALFENCAFLMGQHMTEGFMTGKPVVPMPDRIRAWAVYDTFKASDGEMVFVGVVTDTQWKIFCDAFDLQDLLADPSLKTNPQRVEARPRVIPIVTALFAKMTKAELLAKCEKLGLPFAPITRPEDLFHDPHLIASGGLADITLMNGIKTQVPIMPIEMDGRRFATRLDLPKVGEHTRELLTSLGYAPQDIERLIASGTARAA